MVGLERYKFEKKKTSRNLEICSKVVNDTIGVKVRLVAKGLETLNQRRNALEWVNANSLGRYAPVYLHAAAAQVQKAFGAVRA